MSPHPVTPRTRARVEIEPPVGIGERCERRARLRAALESLETADADLLAARIGLADGLDCAPALPPRAGVPAGSGPAGRRRTRNREQRSLYRLGRHPAMGLGPELTVLRLRRWLGCDEPVPLALAGPMASPGPELNWERRELSGLLRALMERVLSERECQVLAARFGLGGEDRLTLARIADTLGVTREKARQLELIALRKLRAEPELRFFVPADDSERIEEWEYATRTTRPGQPRTPVARHGPLR